MTTTDDKIPHSQIADGRLIWPAPTIHLRALTDDELADLQSAIGKPVDRDYIRHWLSLSIENIVKFSAPPSAAECRDRFLRIVSEGRDWLTHVDQCPGGALVGLTSELQTLRDTVSEFCDRLASTANHLDALAKRGHPKIPIALRAFIENMIGIAKRAEVRPSTPSRGEHTSDQPPPDFFKFLVGALQVAEDVIKTSEISVEQKGAALSILRVQSTQALIKIVEDLRGRVGDYRDSSRGLVEWAENDRTEDLQTEDSTAPSAPHWP